MTNHEAIAVLDRHIRTLASRLEAAKRPGATADALTLARSMRDAGALVARDQEAARKPQER